MYAASFFELFRGKPARSAGEARKVRMIACPEVTDMVRKRYLETVC